ncbi:CRISPR-associated helicase/endonuclease Cas3 [Fusobacterium periodonticum]|uniref:CRISPR-associated helicase Cas3 domain protein n=1 Tax=Fusobacterium periodonticum 1_1_41FAA TaxID=469621 RepID=D6LH61_9FUSO|nr:CRISPR-associated helicase/endonuclease Cas3 [Fusobacterium periodonticum]EFG27737.1 CRISPR-associated helicase Cas3 [Fusobacterium periodonticum 1_1_41FAA]
MENYKINSKLKIYEDIKNIYYAKPDKTLAQHNEELHIQKKKLINLGYLSDEKLIELLEYSIEFHDIGKINSEFQIRVKENKKFDVSKEVAHNILSIYFIDKKDYEDKNDYESITYAVFYHHRFGNGDNDSIRADENTKKIIETLLSKLEEKGIKVIKKLSPSLKLPNLHTDRNLKLLGLLMKCDHSASGGYQIEYPNDFLEVALNELLNEFKEKDKSADWNDMQKFCKENSDKNIIAIADTGMGKTEGGFLWGGNNKIFFVLPLRTAINAMFKRFNEVIIKGENKEERVGLLHSDSLEYYLNNKKELVIDDKDEKEMDILEYNKRGKHLSLPVTICTPDQIFNFILKYKGYESKLATLSYSKIILDEMQMYDANLLAAVIFGITKIIEMGGKIAIVTATFPPIIEYFLNKYLMKNNQNVIKDLDKPNEIVGEEIFIKKKFTNNEKIRHNLVLIDDEIGIQEILWKFKDNRDKKKSSKKILVICNTIKKAQEIYSKLKIELEDYFRELDKKKTCLTSKREDKEEINEILHLLHSNFIREDRESKEQEILNFGKTEFYGEGIWISTSLVEASLDIDFDYLFTELQDLNSLFQRFGRCNRKGKKSVDETNCFIYLKIEDKYLKEKDSRYGFIDKDIYENSKKGLENYCKVVSKNELDNSEDYNELFKSFSKKITEGEKITLIEENLSFENLKDSPFVDEFEKAYDKYQRVLNSDKNSQDDLKLRDIQSVTVIPYNIYEENEENIKEFIKKIKDTNLSLEERQKAKTDLLKKTLSIQYYQLSKYIREILKGKADANKYKSESINKFEKITIMEADYNKELGFRAKDFKDGLPIYEFI